MNGDLEAEANIEHHIANVNWKEPFECDERGR